jgi:hypothetical protein
MAERVDREMKRPKSELFGKLENGDDASRSHSWLSNVAYVSREERARGRVCKVEVVWWKEEEFGAAGRACRTCPRCGGGGGGDSTPVDMVGAGGACTVVATSECICASERSVRAREQSRSAAESRCRLDGEDKPDCSAVAVAVERRRVSEYCMD